MRVLVLADVPPGVVGGAEVQALQLARKWAENGHSVLVAGVNNLPVTEGRLTVIRLPLWQWNRGARGLSYLIVALWLMWRRQSEFDVVYCRFVREHAFAASLARALRLLRRPVVVCPACAAEHGDVRRILRSPVRAIWAWVLRRGGLTINAMSRQIRDEIPLLDIGDTRISSIPNGVLMPELPRDRPRADGPWRVLFVGRLVEQKGVDILLEAARCLQKARHDFVMQIVGDGPLRHALQERVESMALTDCVKFLGPKAPETVGDAFLHADIFVLPSRYEGMPGVLLQALAYGVPVIATRVSGSEDVVSDDVGWLVRGDDAAALTAAFEQAFRVGREGLRAMGALGRELAERTYDMKLIAQSYEALFEELIGEQPKVAR